MPTTSTTILPVLLKAAESSSKYAKLVATTNGVQKRGTTCFADGAPITLTIAYTTLPICVVWHDNPTG